MDSELRCIKYQRLKVVLQQLGLHFDILPALCQNAANERNCPEAQEAGLMWSQIEFVVVINDSRGH